MGSFIGGLVLIVILLIMAAIYFPVKNRVTRLMDDRRYDDDE